ncbi:HNH endonuclease [Glutamicibacter ardleyensis]|uniref:HNH endonuclease n=1 Tax=Glutamicibacter ardleyensis TaxID=225894 RepID=UPI003FD1726C
MATSRTGTSAWLNVSRQVIRDAQDRGQTQCPYCGQTLNYKNRRARNGAQVDHVIPHARGGSDHPSNLIVCCAACNASKGERAAPKTKTITANQPLKTSRNW